MYSRIRYGALVAFLGVILSARVAAQSGEAIALQWDAPPECEERGIVLGEVKRLLGKNWPPAEPVNGVAQVRKTEEGRWLLHLQIKGSTATGERSLQAESCDSIRQAVGLLIAISIDPSLNEKLNAASLRESAAPVKRAETPPQATLSDQKKIEEKPRQPWGFALGVGALLDTYVTPKVTWGIAPQMGLELGDWRLSIRGIYLAPGAVNLSGSSTARARFWLLAAGLEIGKVWPLGSWALLAGGGVEMGNAARRKYGG